MELKPKQVKLNNRSKQANAYRVLNQNRTNTIKRIKIKTSSKLKLMVQVSHAIDGAILLSEEVNHMNHPISIVQLLNFGNNQSIWVFSAHLFQIRVIIEVESTPK